MKRLALYLLFAGSALTMPSRAELSPQDVQIQRITNAILGPALVKGSPSISGTLADRLKSRRVPGVGIAVIREGKVEWARGFGQAETGGAPVTSRTLFQAGSISKPVAAMVVLRLVQAGRLNLDADVSGYLKTWKLPENEFTAREKVTLRRLLSHTAGTNQHGFPGYAAGEAVPTVTQILNGEKPANTSPIRVVAVPGAAYDYSGGGYVIIQKILEDVTRKPFAQLAREIVLTPAGMSDSGFEQPLPADKRGASATPYDQQGKPVAGGPHTYPEMTAAGLWSTASDMARFAIAVQNALAGKPGALLSRELAQQMVNGGLGGWGLGFDTGGSTAAPWFSHSGSDAGFLAMLIAYQNGDGIAVMTNGDGGFFLAVEIVRTVANEYGWPDFQPKEAGGATAK
jgi:CubicO group peptidase (beta-lactamase class C family)